MKAQKEKAMQAASILAGEQLERFKDRIRARRDVCFRHYQDTTPGWHLARILDDAHMVDDQGTLVAIITIIDSFAMVHTWPEPVCDENWRLQKLGKKRLCLGGAARQLLSRADPETTIPKIVEFLQDMAQELCRNPMWSDKNDPDWLDKTVPRWHREFLSAFLAKRSRQFAARDRYIEYMRRRGQNLSSGVGRANARRRTQNELTLRRIGVLMLSDPDLRTAFTRLANDARLRKRKGWVHLGNAIKAGLTHITKLSLTEQAIGIAMDRWPEWSQADRDQKIGILREHIRDTALGARGGTASQYTIAHKATATAKTLLKSRPESHSA